MPTPHRSFWLLSTNEIVHVTKVEPEADCLHKIPGRPDGFPNERAHFTRQVKYLCESTGANLEVPVFSPGWFSKFTCLIASESDQFVGWKVLAALWFSNRDDGGLDIEKAVVTPDLRGIVVGQKVPDPRNREGQRHRAVLAAMLQYALNPTGDDSPELSGTLIFGTIAPTAFGRMAMLALDLSARDLSAPNFEGSASGVFDKTAELAQPLLSPAQ